MAERAAILDIQEGSMRTSQLFEIEVSTAYPCWCRLKLAGSSEVLATFHHGELRQLAYLVDVAMRDARIALGEKYRDEV